MKGLTHRVVPYPARAGASYTVLFGGICSTTSVCLSNLDDGPPLGLRSEARAWPEWGGLKFVLRWTHGGYLGLLMDKACDG